ncbi:response regulator transcription factor [Exilibacterium tricleocarpae]|nr:response regulator transcription factor [Exilibacterium tricleocarpae]
MGRKFITIDEDKEVIDGLTAFFAKHGIKNDNALNISDAKEKISENNYDAVIMEVVLSGGEGISLAKWIKETIGTPLILLTTLTEAVDTAVGLEVGADDYIHKPFDTRVLLARINSLLRVYKNSSHPATNPHIDLLDSNANVFDIKRRRLIVDGRDVTLNSSEFIFVKTLLENQGKPVSRDTLYKAIFERAWNPMDRAVDNIASKLRKKIEMYSDKSTVIITVRNKGYLIPEGTFNLL